MHVTIKCIQQCVNSFLCMSHSKISIIKLLSSSTSHALIHFYTSLLQTKGSKLSKRDLGAHCSKKVQFFSSTSLHYCILFLKVHGSIHTFDEQFYKLCNLHFTMKQLCFTNHCPSHILSVIAYFSWKFMAACILFTNDIKNCVSCIVLCKQMMLHKPLPI